MPQRQRQHADEQRHQDAEAPGIAPAVRPLVIAPQGAKRRHILDAQEREEREEHRHPQAGTEAGQDGRRYEDEGYVEGQKVLDHPGEGCLYTDADPDAEPGTAQPHQRRL